MKKLLYFIPVIFFTILYVFLFFVGAGMVEILGLVWLVLFTIAGVLLAYGKYWGSGFGLIPAIGFIYIGLQNHGQIFNEWAFGIILLIYYVVLSYFVYRKENK